MLRSRKLALLMVQLLLLSAALTLALHQDLSGDELLALPRMLLFDVQAAQSPLPVDVATPGVYGGLTAEPSPTPAPELTMDESEAAAVAAAADASTTADASSEPSSPALQLDPTNEPPQSEPAADQAEVSSASQQPSDEQASAVDQAAAPVEQAAPAAQPFTDSSSGSSDVIPVVDEGAVQVDDSTEAADGRGRAAELVQRSSDGAGLADGTAGSVLDLPAQGSGGWSGAQAAGLAVGLIAAAGLTGVAVMRYKRRQVPQQQQYTYGSEVEMRGLI